MNRFWTYSRDEWEPKRRWLPSIGGDEYGRRTLVVAIPFSGYLVWAYRTCHCNECTFVRMQTWRWDRDDFAGWPEWLVEWAGIGGDQ